MAHSHDKTLLSKLGFTDPDKESPKHFLACQYLAQPYEARTLCEIVRAVTDHPQSEVVGVELEYRIGRGTRTSPTTVGFADLIITLSNIWDYRWLDKKPTPSVNQWIGEECWPPKWQLLSFIDETTTRGCRHDVPILVEVKVQPVGMDAVIRQIKFYRSHMKVFRAIAVTLFPVSIGDVATLKAEGIDHVYLGEGFAMWCAERDNSPAESPEL